MFGNISEFVWERPAGREGFGWEHEIPLAPSPVPPALMLATKLDARFTNYAPFKQASGLFLTFAELNPTPEAVLSFADTYGRLTVNATATRMGYREAEDFNTWKEAIPRMRLLVQLWKLLQAGDEQGLSHQVRWGMIADVPHVLFTSPRDVRMPDIEPWDLWTSSPHVPVRPRKSELTLAGAVDQSLSTAALIVLNRLLSDLMSEGVAPSIYWYAAKKRSIVDVLPKNLLAAMYLQLALAIAENKEYRMCRECGRPFEVSPRVNRSSRLTCSAACRNKSYRERQDRARQLYAAGKSFREIAKDMESEVKTVKGWIQGRKG